MNTSGTVNAHMEANLITLLELDINMDTAMHRVIGGKSLIISVAVFEKSAVEDRVKSAKMKAFS